MNGEELREFNRREVSKLRIVGYSFVVFIPIILVIVFFTKSMEKDITSPLVSAINSHEANAVLCSEIALDVEELKKAFEGVFTSKVSGSYPTERVSISVNGVERIVGRDSREVDLIWVMPREKSGELQILVGGYVRSVYLSEHIGECVNKTLISPISAQR
ncbi:hypothetical protein CWC31_15590 [Pseudoalteromonas ruthenica]|uniref:hypothetical protein n=1 Tax=Pseudoalteromonas ruthenica TaxID=151081 RepID=UPI001108DBCB|nr:hypothetical protein [Pseudoalteromonas ruthenica]TLX49688.1 hypothetical protein CWC31_15590 [Pseudoalteromonas ruthenica]